MFELRLTSDRAGDLKNLTQGLQLRLPREVTVDDVFLRSRCVRISRNNSAFLSVHARVLIDGLGTDVEGACPTTRNRKVRRSLLGETRLGCMQGIDLQEVCTIARNNCRQISQILGIPHPPRAARTRGVELSRDPPTLVAIIETARKSLRNNDQGRGAFAAIFMTSNNPVPSLRQPVGNLKGRTTDQISINHSRRDRAI